MAAAAAARSSPTASRRTPDCVELFGAAGEHARLAVGVGWLPANLALEIELLIDISEQRQERVA